MYTFISVDRRLGHVTSFVVSQAQLDLNSCAISANRTSFEKVAPLVHAQPRCELLKKLKYIEIKLNNTKKYKYKLHNYQIHLKNTISQNVH